MVMFRSLAVKVSGSSFDLVALTSPLRLIADLRNFCTFHEIGHDCFSSSDFSPRNEYVIQITLNSPKQ
jgi:hypothetical protein